jgi:hypothetical protein
MDASSNTLQVRYRNFHLWMLLPFAISILGFSYSYYLRLSSATFHQHVHGISATLWYVLVVVQPYLVVRRRNVQGHRALGAMALLVAGVVAGSALTIIPKNIDDVGTLDENGFFDPTFAYFAVLIDLLLVSMFLASVCMAILRIKRKDLSGHVQWLMASVFFVLSPGLARLLGLSLIVANQGNMDGISLVKLAVPSMAAMIALVGLYYWKFGSFRHASFSLLLVCHLPYLFVERIGDSPSFRDVVSVIFK